VDYRKLNEATRVASYPLLNMTETLDQLADAKCFLIEALKVYRPYLLGRELELFTDHKL